MAKEEKNESYTSQPNTKEFDYDERLASNSSIVNNAKYALTTKDNPYNPFSQFGDWLMYDNLHGYGSCSYLARIAKTSNALTDAENNSEIEDAIDEIIKNDPTGLYQKAINKDFKVAY